MALLTGSASFTRFTVAGELPGSFWDFVAERVAPHEKVRAVTFIDAIPKSTSGKILRRDLKGR